MAKKIIVEDFIGKTFNLLTIVDVSNKTDKGKSKYCIVLCICGNKKEMPASPIISGKYKSCGCKRSSKHNAIITHGLSNHKTYLLWRHIKSRCLNKNSKYYSYYGGRGICIDEIWINDAKSFCDWCFANGWEEGLQIDRIDNNGNYSPDNCRFVTAKINGRNKRNNTLIEYKGQTKTLGDWAETLGINCHTMSSRLNRGHSLENIMSVNHLKPSGNF